MSALSRGAGPPKNEATRQSGSTDARPRTSESSNADALPPTSRRHKRATRVRGVAGCPSAKAIEAAMAFLAPGRPR